VGLTCGTETHIAICRQEKPWWLLILGFLIPFITVSSPVVCLLEYCLPSGRENVIPGTEFLPPKWGSYSLLFFSLYALKKHVSQ